MPHNKQMQLEATVLNFETERMLIRPLSLDDAPALTAILSDAEVMKYSVRGACDEAATSTFIKWCLSCYESHSIGPLALIDKESRDIIGFCGVGPEPVGEAVEINLGYRLAKRYWGLGLATESVRAVLAYALGENAFKSVVMIIEPEHGASMRVAEKAGFTDFKNTRFHGREVRLYRMTSEQWSSCV
ncbi:MAG: GNAT family N-acetyltransferase [Motiliproteus sp.]